MNGNLQKVFAIGPQFRMTCFASSRFMRFWDILLLSNTFLRPLKLQIVVISSLILPQSMYPSLLTFVLTHHHKSNVTNLNRKCESHRFRSPAMISVPLLRHFKPRIVGGAVEAFHICTEVRVPVGKSQNKSLPKLSTSKTVVPFGWNEMRLQRKPGDSTGISSSRTTAQLLVVHRIARSRLTAPKY